MNLWSPDPRAGRCVRWIGKGDHTYRIGALTRSGKPECVYCGRVKGRRYRKPTSGG